MTLDLKRVEATAIEYLEADEEDREWPIIKSNFANLAGTPHVVLDLVSAVRAA
ncbi:MAG TPA: hypothetical protein VFF81_00645 [Noviherbaspirillum sp.]|nr:hypothetical protein [Noviherbaspirillum sp.]